MKIRQILEGKTTKVTPPKPRNFVAKNAVQSGAGAHKDKKKAMKQGDVKHKNKELAVDETFSDDVKDTVSNAASKIGDTVANVLPKELRPFDNQTAANFSNSISKQPQPTTTKTKLAVKESTRNPDLMSPTDYDRYQQNQMDYEKRAFKRDELEHELGHEEKGYYQVMIAKNGKWDYAKVQPRREGMNAAMDIIRNLHNKYPSMHLGMMWPNGHVENFGKGRK